VPITVIVPPAGTDENTLAGYDRDLLLTLGGRRVIVVASESFHFHICDD
jgi:hypothetical protein